MSMGGLSQPECSPGTLERTSKVNGCEVFLHIRSVFGWSKSDIPILASNPDVGSARFYCQFSLDKMWTLQAGSRVPMCIIYPKMPPSAKLTQHANLFTLVKGYIHSSFAPCKSELLLVAEVI